MGKYRRKICYGALCLFVLGLVVAPAGVRGDLVLQTQINGSSLTGYGGILDSIYGWDNLERVDDFGSGVNDQYWTYSGDSGGSALVVAKNAGFPHRFGTLLGEVGWDFDRLTTLGANKNGIYGQTHGMPEQHWQDFNSGDTGDIFRFGLDLPSHNGYTWSSVIADNLSMPGGFAGDGFDHTVTWRIAGNSGFSDNEVGNYVMGWEDLSGTGGLGGFDADYNDLVVEVSGVVPVPEPMTLTLMLLGGVFVYHCRKMGIKKGIRQKA